MARELLIADDFTVKHQTNEKGEHILIIAPVKENDGYEPVQLAITSKQWDELRFKFVIGSRAGDKLQKLAYVF